MPDQHTGFAAEHLVHTVRAGGLTAFDVVSRYHGQRGQVGAVEPLLLTVQCSNSLP
jgi:hypothetical protein